MLAAKNLAGKNRGQWLHFKMDSPLGIRKLVISPALEVLERFADGKAEVGWSVGFERLQPSVRNGCYIKIYQYHFNYVLARNSFCFEENLRKQKHPGGVATAWSLLPE